MINHLGATSIFSTSNEWDSVQKSQNISNKKQISIPISDRNFRQIFNEKVQQNPFIKIQKYLAYDAIISQWKMKCRNSVQRDQERILLTEGQNLELKKTESKRNMQNSQIDLKLQFQRKNVDATKPQREDVEQLIINAKKYFLPFSRHHQLVSQKSRTSGVLSPLKLFNSSLTRSESIGISISEGMLKSPEWQMREERQLMEVFNNLLRSHLKEYSQKLIKYRRETATFIRDNYINICKLRWKHILEYNNLRVKEDKKQSLKKQKQLRKLLRCIGCEELLINDVLPQKYLILEEAQSMKGCPVKPERLTAFGYPEFKKYWRLYSDSMIMEVKTFNFSKKSVYR